MVTADGMSLVWAAMLLKKIKIERVYGPDLLLKTCQLSKNKKISHYFYGSTNPVLKKLTVNLKLKFPNLKIAGFYPPPFKKLTSLKRNKILNNVKAKRPNIVWVGLGCPKQNLWAAMASKKLHHFYQLQLGL